MIKFSSAQDLILKIMRDDEQARNSDDYLYLRVCSEINPDVLARSFKEVMPNLRSLGLPSYETVRRARQKLQAADVTLCGADMIEHKRILLEEEFKNYARKPVCV